MYYILAVILMVASLIVQARLKSLTKKYSKIPAASGKTANMIVDEMLHGEEVYGIEIDHKSGELSDCYSPKEGSIYLSDTCYNRDSVAAIAVAAHEAGHALQDAKGMPLYKARQFLAPIAGISSKVGVYITFLGVIIMYVSKMNFYDTGYLISTIGIMVYSIAFLFYLVMLPVERDASRRGIKAMKEYGWVSDDQLPGAKKMLRAAGDTYAIALASSALTLFRLLLMRGGKRRR